MSEWKQNDAPDLWVRAKNILMKPEAEWEVIRGESTSIGQLYKSYILPLAAIGPVAAMIGSLVFGYSALGIVFRPSVGSALSAAIVQYLLTLAMVFVLALIIDALAPSFGGTANRIQAMKVATYSATAGWLAGIFGLVPALAALSLLGLYGLYLLYLGLPKLMLVPPEKANAFRVVVILAAFVAFLIIGSVAAQF